MGEDLEKIKKLEILRKQRQAQAARKTEELSKYKRFDS